MNQELAWQIVQILLIPLAVALWEWWKKWRQAQEEYRRKTQDDSREFTQETEGTAFKQVLAVQEKLVDSQINMTNGRLDRLVLKIDETNKQQMELFERLMVAYMQHNREVVTEMNKQQADQFEKLMAEYMRHNKAVEERADQQTRSIIRLDGLMTTAAIELHTSREVFGDIENMFHEIRGAVVPSRNGKHEG